MNRHPATCGSDDTLRDAERAMQGGNCEFLPVMAGGRSRCLVGVITDGDIRMAVQLEGRSLEEFRVRDVMAKEVRVCSPDDDLAETTAIMEEAGIRRLPVVDEAARLLGILSLGKLMDRAEREADVLDAQISAAHFGLVASRIHEPHPVGERM